MKLTGHRTVSVYRRYAIVAGADLREGVHCPAIASRVKQADKLAATTTEIRTLLAHNAEAVVIR